VKKKEQSVSLPARKMLVKKIPARKSLADKTPKPFPIVGFGASAGGIQAFTTLLSKLDAHLGMAYVLVMHLSPTHKSALTEIVQSKTSMPVQTVKDGMEVMANNIYVIPPNTFMTVVDGHLKLAPRSLSAIGNYAIDYFFTALASIYKNNAIGVILSGTATDGTLGLKAIKAEGGITFAQDETAEFSGMPGHAADSGHVDFVLPPERIAEELTRLVKTPYTVLPSEKIEQQQVKEIDNNAEELKTILSIVKNKTGVDFYAHYKQASVYRRVARRMVLNKFAKLKDYCSMLKSNPNEVDALYDDFLINVTSFFRDPEFYKILGKEVFPALVKQRQSDDPLRIWVAGCATGEEAYSVAICLIEFLEKSKSTIPVQIFASDLDASAIEHARLGVYSLSTLQGVTPLHLKRYFVKVDNHYQVIKSVREICVFAQHNLLKDPPFSRMNLISCQNVLIYLESNPQKRILQTFHYALKQGGYLFLSKSETIGSSTELFEPLDKKIRLYSRKPTKSVQLEFTVRTPDFVSVKDSNQRQEQRMVDDVEKDMSKLILSRFVYPSVVVNKDMVITQFFGVTSPYLSPLTGKASLNILKMIREDLVIDLRSLFQKVKKTETAAAKEGILIHTNGILQEIAIEIVPKRIGDDLFFLIVFKENNVIPLLSKNEKKESNGSTDQKEKKILKLEEELVQSLEVIRTTNEEYETTYEELQANNEEILSSNEELQSVNEELETSKEELQSSNEELTTIIDELNKRNIELKESQDYAEAIVETMHGPLLVLTSTLQVRMANKAFYETFQLTSEKTEGSFIYDLGDGAWDIPALREHLREVFPKNSNFKDFELKHSFPGVGERDLIVNAYRLVKGVSSKETLILLAFNDITRRFKAEASVLKMQEQLKLSLIGDAIGAWWWIFSTNEVKWSRENELLNGVTEGTFGGTYTDWENLIYSDDIEGVKNAVKKSIAEKIPLETEYRIQWPDNTFHWILSRGHIYYDEQGQPERMVGVSMDNTERKLRSERLESQVDLRTAELMTANKELMNLNQQLEQFVFVSSHDLQEPLRKIQTFSSLLSNPSPHSHTYIKKYSDRIHASASRMSHLLKDLLSFTILIRRDKIEKVKVNLNDVVENIIKDSDDIIRSTNAVINFSTLPVVSGDPHQLNQLFHNLIGNAMKFSDKAPLISITSRNSTWKDFSLYHELKKDTVYISVSVNDNGIGFDQVFAEKIFLLFQRLSDKKDVEGTGIGLSICKKIVENHDGFIYASGEKGVGATFTVFLPMGG
jgi:two-component system CheB/CheR fusion protein